MRYLSLLNTWLMAYSLSPWIYDNSNQLCQKRMIDCNPLYTDQSPLAAVNTVYQHTNCIPVSVQQKINKLWNIRSDSSAAYQLTVLSLSDKLVVTEAIWLRGYDRSCCLFLNDPSPHLHPSALLRKRKICTPHQDVNCDILTLEFAWQLSTFLFYL